MASRRRLGPARRVLEKMKATRPHPDRARGAFPSPAETSSRRSSTSQPWRYAQRGPRLHLAVRRASSRRASRRGRTDAGQRSEIARSSTRLLLLRARFARERGEIAAAADSSTARSRAHRRTRGHGEARLGPPAARRFQGRYRAARPGPRHGRPQRRWTPARRGANMLGAGWPPRARSEGASGL